MPVTYVGLPLTDVLPATEDLPDWGEAAYVATRYGAMVSEGGPMLTSAIQALATETALPAVMHCSAGKDRTGVLSALVLAFLGVPDETIVADYTLSAAAMGRLLERLKAEYPDAVEEVERYAPAVLHVVPETMEQFLAELRVQHSTYELLAESLGVTEAMAVLRTTVLVDA
jgi:protein-tyrosine phosphatase